MTTEIGRVDLAVPRDRAGTFAPVTVPKHQRRLEGLSQNVTSLYAKGLTTGAATVDQVTADFQEPGMPEEINRLGRTLWRWRAQISNWHAARVTNAPTEAAILWSVSGGRMLPVPAPQPLYVQPRGHVPVRGPRHPTAAGDNTSRAIYVTGGYSPTRRGEQPAPTLPRQSRSTR